MHWVTASQKTLQMKESHADNASAQTSDFADGVTKRSVHELLFDPAASGSPPAFPALMLAKKALTPQPDGQPTSNDSKTMPRMLVWIDPAHTLYPPAMLTAGIEPRHLCILRPKPADLVWAAIECLRCRSVGAVVAMVMTRMTRVEVRRLQLAAEKGGGTGLLMRPNLASAGINTYAAATRWLVSPAQGERTIQRWRIQLIHGHGGRIGKTFLLEKNRASGQTNLVYPPAPLVYHPTISAAS